MKLKITTCTMAGSRNKKNLDSFTVGTMIGGFDRSVHSKIQLSEHSMPISNHLQSCGIMDGETIDHDKPGNPSLAFAASVEFAKHSSNYRHRKLYRPITESDYLERAVKIIYSYTNKEVIRQNDCGLIGGVDCTSATFYETSTNDILLCLAQFTGSRSYINYYDGNSFHPILPPQDSPIYFGCPTAIPTICLTHFNEDSSLLLASDGLAPSLNSEPSLAKDIMTGTVSMEDVFYNTKDRDDSKTIMLITPEH